MVTQMLQISELFHNGYIADIHNSTTPEIVKRKTLLSSAFGLRVGPCA